MKKLLLILILSSLFLTNTVNAALVDSYNLRCNHIYDKDWEYTVIIDLKNKCGIPEEGMPSTISFVALYFS